MQTKQQVEAGRVVPTIHNIGWDWNGTLCNDGPTFFVDGFIPALEHYELPVPEYEELRHQYSVHGPDDAVAQQVRKAGRKPGSVTWDEHIQPLLPELLKDIRPPMAWGALKILERMHDRGIEMCLISGLNTRLLEAELTERELWHYFKYVRGGVKNKRQYMRKFVRDMKLHRSPRKVLYVSDMAMDLRQVWHDSFTVAYTGGYGSVESLEKLRVPVLDKKTGKQVVDAKTGRKKWQMVSPHATISRWDQLEKLAEFERLQW